MERGVIRCDPSPSPPYFLLTDYENIAIIRNCNYLITGWNFPTTRSRLTRRLSGPTSQNQMRLDFPLISVSDMLLY